MNIALNLRLTSKILGTVVCIVSIAMLPAMVASLYFKEYQTAFAFAISSLLFLAGGAFARAFSRSNTFNIRARDGFLIVSLSWIIASLIGSTPYIFSGYSDSFFSAFFESAAGFTTTGATVFDITSMPSGLMFWKAICNWLGGMGILVFLVTLLPALGISGQKIFKAESPGIKVDKISSRISDSAKMLYLIYISFTLLEFLLLILGSDMPIFDAIINTLGSISTGGVFSHPQGLAYYDSVYIELVLSIFTLLSSVNFTLYPLLIQGGFSRFFKNVELRVFLGIVIFASILICLNLYLTDTYDTIGQSLRYGCFQVASFSTTSGYAITNYSVWPLFSKITMFILMIIGGCAASTSGSIKVIRIIIMFKMIQRNIYKRIHPRAFISVKIGETPLQEELISQTASFVFAFFATLAVGTLLLSLQGLDMEMTFSTALSMLSNTGIALSEAGYTGYFGMYSPPLQMVLSALMIFGRLEIFTILLLFIPSFWNPDRAKSL